MKKRILLLCISLFIMGLLTACGEEDMTIYTFEDEYKASFEINSAFIDSMSDTTMDEYFFESKKDDNTTLQLGRISGNRTISLSPYANAEYMDNFFQVYNGVTEHSFEKVDGYKYECAVYKMKRYDHYEVYYFIEDGLVYYELSASYTDADKANFEKALKNVLDSLKYSNNEFANNGMTVETDAFKLTVPAGYYATAYVPKDLTDYTLPQEQLLTACYYHTDNIENILFEYELSTLTGYDRPIEAIAQDLSDRSKKNENISSVSTTETTIFDVPAYCVTITRNHILLGFTDEYQTATYFFQIDGKKYQLTLSNNKTGEIDIKDFEALINGTEFK